MILKFDFQRDEVSFSLFLSHPSALSCIGCTDQTLHIFPLHELFQDSELLFRAGRYLIPPMIRQNRKIIIPPLGIFFVIDFRLRKFHQMPYTPADKVAIALHINHPRADLPQSPSRGSWQPRAFPLIQASFDTAPFAKKLAARHGSKCMTAM